MGIIARQSIKGTIVTYIGVFVGFITTFFVLTRFLSAEEIGLVRVLTDTAVLFVGLAGLGTTTSTVRFFPYFKQSKVAGENDTEAKAISEPVENVSERLVVENVSERLVVENVSERLVVENVSERSDPHASNSRRNSYNGFFFWTVSIPFIGFLIFTIIYWALHIPLQNIFAEKSPLFVDYYYFVLPLAFFMLYQTIFETNANVLMRIVVPKMVRELWIRVFLLVSYLLYAFRYISLDGLIIMICGSYGLATLANIIYVFAYGHISLRPDFSFPDRTLVRKYLFYTLFLILSAVATVITPTLSSYFITAQMGLDSTGVFAIATYMAAMVAIPFRSLNAIANPQVAQTIKDNDNQSLSTLIKQVSNNGFLVGTLILALIWTNIDFIFHILPNGETYEVGKYVVLLLGISQLNIATFNINASVLNYSSYYYLSLILSFILTVLSLILNNFLIPIWGINGAALASVLSYSIYYGLLCLITRILCHVSVFSTGHLKTLAVILTLTALCYAVDLININIFAATAVKISIWCLTIPVIIRLNISPEMNNTLKTLFRKR